ncbi:MAG: CPBP family intramembrane metalloprotease [Planctomycetes bacterium]|nr:CPBP family intramembrane metalloprotease [Planctomycetota bacterium]
MMKLMLLQQLTIIAGPALIMAFTLTTSPRETLGIRWPATKWLAAGMVLPFLLHPLSVEAVSSLHWFFGELPPEVTRPFAAMSDENLSLGFVLLAFAVAPGICEEIAFRGFILSGCAHGGRRVLAIVMSSVAFGIMHMIPQQVFNATLLGLVIGTLAVRSRSLFPCILFHFLNNMLGVAHGRIGKTLPSAGWQEMFFAQIEGSLRYRWPTCLICVAFAAPILVWLARPLFGGQRVADEVDFAHVLKDA